MKSSKYLLAAGALLALVASPALAYEAGTWVLRAGVGVVAPDSDNLVVDDGAGVGLEGVLHALAEADGLRRDHVHERATLHTREDGAVELFGVLLATENHAAARAAQCFVGGGGDQLRHLRSGLVRRTGSHVVGRHRPRHDLGRRQ